MSWTLCHAFYKFLSLQVAYSSVFFLTLFFRVSAKRAKHLLCKAYKTRIVHFFTISFRLSVLISRSRYENRNYND